MKTVWIAIWMVVPFALSASAESRQPNVLFFALDDMNDWVGAVAPASFAEPGPSGGELNLTIEVTPSNGEPKPNRH